MAMANQRGEVLATDSLNDSRMITIMFGPYLKFRSENIFKTKISNYGALTNIKY